MKNVRKALQEQFNVMAATGKLFRSSVTGRDVWDIYLSSFEPENDPVFRDPESSTHNCNLCKNFLRRYGNIVAITENNEIITMFDCEVEEEYQNSFKNISLKLKNSIIQEVFFETFNELNSLPYEKCNKNNTTFQLGIDKNYKQYSKDEAELYGVVKPEETRTFEHLSLKIPSEFIDKSGESSESMMAKYRDAKNVFKRGLEEISLDTLKLVKDLIIQESLLDGTTHLYKVDEFIKFKEQYDKLSESEKDNWCWKTSYQLPIAKFRNELIGVLCTELSEGEELNKACQSWNKRVDPANYMKAKAPITKRQIQEAKDFVQENGYEESFQRRFATIDDIKASEIKFINSGDGKIKEVSIFDNVSATKSQHKRNKFDDVEEVSIEKFMKDILPNCSSVEALLENKHQNNMVVMTTSENEDSKPIFKWNNNYSWTFNGNLTGKSQIKDSVKTRGGKVDGVLRFSIMWAEGNSDNSDLDAHCILPNNHVIYYGDKDNYETGGNLDIDIQTPSSYASKDIVENITFPDLNEMKDGKYTFLIHQYAERNSQGFKAEIEFNGEIYTYQVNDKLRQGSKTIVAEVTLKDGQFSIEHKLPETNSSKEIWNLDTNEFQKVDLVCLSPNHWKDNKVGNKHYFFMLDKCKSKGNIRSFHNENLIEDLRKHRKVMEVLASQSTLEYSDKQLAGLGFNSTVRDELIVKLSGNFKRIVKIKF